MLSKYAEANAFNTSGAYNGVPPAAPPQVGPAAEVGAFVMCSASIRSISARLLFQKHCPPILLKTLAIHIL